MKTVDRHTDAIAKAAMRRYARETLADGYDPRTLEVCQFGYSNLRQFVLKNAPPPEGVELAEAVGDLTDAGVAHMQAAYPGAGDDALKLREAWLVMEARAPEREKSQ